MHTCAFVVTTMRRGNRRPTPEELRKAAAETTEIAVDAIGRVGDHNRPETLSIGSYHQHGYIQGGTPRPEDENYSWQFWSENAGREENETVPDEAIKAHWNTTDAVLRMAISPEPPGRHGRVITPDLLIVGFGDITEIGERYIDVFGDDQDAIIRPNHASKILGTSDYSHAHHLALQPIENLRRAEFRVKYIQALDECTGRICFQLDWNL